MAKQDNIFNNGVLTIDKVKQENIKKSDVLLDLFSLFGARVSSMPNTNCKIKLIDRLELFDPIKVTNKDSIIYPWYLVYERHNQKDMKDCRDLKYRYLHVPFEIIPSYPKVPCSGIFCITDNTLNCNKISSNDLIWIGNEFRSEY